MIFNNKLYWLLSLFLVLFCTKINAQQTSHINFNVEDGLPSSEVYDIIQDKYGYIWFSTDKGLSRYDGYNFQNFGLETGIPDPIIFDFFEDSHHRIWCTSFSGELFYFEGRQPKFTPYPYNSIIKKYKFNRAPNGIHVSKNNDISMVFHNTLGYLRISKNGSVLKTPSLGFMKEKKTGYSVEKIENSQLYYLRKNNKRFDSLNDYSIPYENLGQTKIEGANNLKLGNIYTENKKIHLLNDNIDTVIVRKKRIISIGIVDSQKFWVGYLNGGVEFFSKNGVSLSKNLQDYSVTQLYNDNQGNTWISTLEKGVFLYSNGSIGFIKSTTGLNINSISRSSSNTLIMGTQLGEIYHLNNWEVTKSITSELKHPSWVIYDSIRKTNYFVSDKLFSDDFILDERISGNYIKLIDNRFLVTGIYSSLVFDIDHSSNEYFKLFEGHRVNNIHKYNKKIFAATSSGVYYIDSLKDTNQKELLSDCNATSIENTNDYLLIGTKGNGLIWLNKDLKHINAINTTNGLSSNFIHKISIQNDTTFWLSTNRGINIIYHKESTIYEVLRLSHQDGLLSNDIQDIIFRSDTAWIGTAQGVNFISLQNLGSSKSEYQLFLNWDFIYVNGVKSSKKNTFTYNENSFSFGFSAIRLNSGSELTYRYKLIGGDYENWTETKNKSIDITSLRPGKYKLIVEAYGSRKESNIETISYSFQIKPPYWSTWWFLVLCISLTIVVIVLFFKIRVLTYNKDIVREIMKEVLKFIRKNEPTINVRHNGNSVMIKTKHIGFIKTDGNYLEIHTKENTFLVRSSIAKILKDIPDHIEFVQVHKSYVVRQDNIREVGSKSLIVFEYTIPIGRKFLNSFKSYIELKRLSKNRKISL